ncbi:type II secretion system protein [bacterium]|nr:MAG: type II secretion system protein [bacterium]
MLLIGKNNTGFTLIEIMLAVVILSFGLVLVLRSFATSLDGMKRSGNVKAASYLLEEKMEEVKEKAKEDGGITRGCSSGEFEKSDCADLKNTCLPAGRDYTDHRWDLSVKQSGVDEDLNEVELVISWQEGKSKRSLFATTYLENQD